MWRNSNDIIKLPVLQQIITQSISCQPPTNHQPPWQSTNRPESFSLKRKCPNSPTPDPQMGISPGLPSPLRQQIEYLWYLWAVDKTRHPKIISMDFIPKGIQSAHSNKKIVKAHRIITLEKIKPDLPVCTVWDSLKNGKESQTVKQLDRTNFKFHNGLPQ